MIIAISIGVELTMQAFGNPEILRFRDGKKGAISLEFDDSMSSQIKNALPLLKNFGVHATFFINPGAGHYAPNKRIWETEIEKAGQELGNHTLTHKGAKSDEEAVKEIQACADVINRIHHGKPRIVPFATPGGVPWVVTPAKITELHHKLISFGTERRYFIQDSDSKPPTWIPAKAMDEQTWIELGMHGVGGEWLSTSVPNLTLLLNYLRDHQSEIWVAPTGEVYKYIQERSATRVALGPMASSRFFRVEVTCDEAKINPFHRPFGELFDVPLSVRLTVPVRYKKYRVTQGNATRDYDAKLVNGSWVATFDALPNAGAATLSPR